MAESFFHASSSSSALATFVQLTVDRVFGTSVPFVLEERLDRLRLDDWAPESAGTVDALSRLRVFAPAGDLLARRMHWRDGEDAWRLRASCSADLSTAGWRPAGGGDPKRGPQQRFPLLGSRVEIGGEVYWYEAVAGHPIRYPVRGAVPAEKRRVVLVASPLLDAFGRPTDWRWETLEVA
jgi:hypothetical protein